MRALSFISLSLRLSAALCFCAASAKAEQPFVRIGTSIGVAGKLGLLFPAGDAYAPWGRAGFDLCVLLEGAEEQALSLVTRVGLFADHTQYPIVAGSRFGIERYQLSCNPEILFPTRFPRLKIMAGFALEYTMATDFYIRTSDDYTGYGNYDLEASAAIVTRVERKLLPLFTLGCSYAVRPGLWLQISAKQALLNAFMGDPVIYAGSNSSGITLHHQPLYLGLSCTYYFGKRTS